MCAPGQLAQSGAPVAFVALGGTAGASQPLLVALDPPPAGLPLYGAGRSGP